MDWCKKDIRGNTKIRGLRFALTSSEADPMPLRFAQRWCMKYITLNLNRCSVVFLFVSMGFYLFLGVFICLYQIDHWHLADRVLKPSLVLLLRISPLSSRRMVALVVTT